MCLVTTLVYRDVQVYSISLIVTKGLLFLWHNELNLLHLRFGRGTMTTEAVHIRVHNY